MSLARRAVVSVPLTARMVAAYAADRTLALDPGAIGRHVAVAAAPSSGPAPRSGRVAVVAVLGPVLQRAQAGGLCGGAIAGWDSVADDVCAALAADADAVLLVIDSPGGEVSGLEGAVERIRAARDAAGKPIVSYADEMIASAAYWLAAAVSDGGVFVPATGCVGAIGTCILHVEESRALDAAGISPTVIRSSPNKYAPNALEPLTDTGRARLQARVDETAGRFFAAVSNARGISVDAVRHLDAALVYGAAAVSAGLADGVASLDEVIARASTTPRARTSSNTRTAPHASTNEGTETMGKKARKAAALGMSLATYKQVKSAGKAAKASAGAAEPVHARNALAARARRTGVSAEALAATEAALGTHGVAGAVDETGRPLYPASAGLSGSGSVTL